MNRKRAIEISIAVCDITIDRIEFLKRKPEGHWHTELPCDCKPTARVLFEREVITRNEMDELNGFYSCALCAECNKHCWKCIAAPLWAEWMTKAQVKKLVPLCVNSQTSPYRAFRRATNIDTVTGMIIAFRQGLTEEEIKQCTPSGYDAAIEQMEIIKRWLVNKQKEEEKQ